MLSISLYNLFISLLPLIIVWYFYQKWVGNKKEIVIATFRMLTQLLLIGYVLVYIFEEKNSFIGFLIISFMILISSIIAIRNSDEKSLKHYFIILTAIAISGVFHLILIIKFVLEISPFYEPRFIIPIAGMIFANSMNSLSLTIERFSKELSRSESFERARSISFKSAMIPQINSFFAVGLVSLPGMMTGQILSGVDPLIAVRYQIMILAIILSSSGISNIIYYTLRSKIEKIPS